MDYHQIMTKINSDLTGNYEQDARYLMAQYKIYENHEDYEEISRAIRAFMYNLIPDDKAFALKKALNKENHIEDILLKAKFMMQNNDFNKALEMMEFLINELEKTLEVFSDDDFNEFHNFDEFFEEQIYMEIFKPMKKIRQMPWNFALAYLEYGAILFELKKFDKAKIFLEKANKINPISTSIMFELSEVSKINKNWDEYIKITNKCFEYAYSSEGLARCYRNYGYYFIEQNDYEAATAAYCIAMIFSYGSKKKFPQIEIQYLKQLTGKTNAEIGNMLQNNLGEMAKKLKKYNIQLGANKSIMTLALTLGMTTTDGTQNLVTMTENCLLILRDIAKYKELYDLVGDEDINAIVKVVISTEEDILKKKENKEKQTDTSFGINDLLREKKSIAAIKRSLEIEFDKIKEEENILKKESLVAKDEDAKLKECKIIAQKNGDEMELETIKKEKIVIKEQIEKIKEKRMVLKERKAKAQETMQKNLYWRIRNYFILVHRLHKQTPINLADFYSIEGEENLNPYQKESRRLSEEDKQRLSAGLKYYKWRTGNDERVCEFCKNMAGYICRWDDSTVVYDKQSNKWIPRNETQKHTHPGVECGICDFGGNGNCRCTASPYDFDMEYFKT